MAPLPSTNAGSLVQLNTPDFVTVTVSPHTSLSLSSAEPSTTISSSALEDIPQSTSTPSLVPSASEDVVSLSFPARAEGTEAASSTMAEASDDSVSTLPSSDDTTPSADAPSDLSESVSVDKGGGGGGGGHSSGGDSDGGTSGGSRTGTTTTTTNHSSGTSVRPSKGALAVTVLAGLAVLGAF